MSFSFQNKKARMGLNLASNIFAFFVTFCISFYISPIIVSKFGADAYGFIGLSNEFVSYVSIIAIVFNSVGSRFIANEYYKGNKREASNYFNALVSANLLISLFIILVGLLLIPHMEKVINIPTELVKSVKIVFAISFCTYAISLATNTYSAATFVKNITAVNGFVTAGVNIIRFALIIFLLNCVSLQLYWVPFSSGIAALVGGIAYIITAKKVLPEIFPNPFHAKFEYIQNLAKSGIWMSFTSLGVILVRNVDLLIANQGVGSASMGYLSIARTMPNSITSILSTVGPLFTPLLVQRYAQNDKTGIGVTTSKSIDTVYSIMLVPICGYIVLSSEFTFLWHNELSADITRLIGSLSAITAIQALFNSSGCVNSQLSVVTNKLKIPVFITLGCGIVNICLTILLLHTTNLGLYAIVISGTAVMVVRYICFNPIYAAKIIGQPWYYFYKDLFFDWIAIPVVLGCFFLIKKTFIIDSWGQLILVAFILGTFGYTIVLGYFAIVRRLKRKHRLKN